METILRSILMLLLLPPLSTMAEIHNWQDASGTPSFGDQPVDQHSTPLKTPPLNTFHFKAPKPSEQQPAKVKPPKVTLYTTSWCGFCRKARAYFRQQGIKFVDYDVEKNADAARRKQTLDKKYKSRGVPLAIINNHVIYGFNPANYQHAIESSTKDSMGKPE